MAFNTDPGLLRERVEEEDRIRRRLEASVAREFRQLFRRIGADITDIYTLTGRVADADQYIEETAGFLRNAYRRTTTEFNHFVEDHILENSENEEEELVNAITLAALQRGTSFDEELGRFLADRNIRTQQFINNTVPIRVQEITSTTQKNIDRAVAKSLQLAEESEEPTTQREIGAEAGALFVSANLFRGEMIAETEILTAGEGSKSLEVAAFMAAAGILGALLAEKIWITAGDEVVRPTHQAVDFVVVPEDENFTVGGFPMSGPGDSSQGAPASEIIRCRCSSQHVIQ